MFKHPVPLLIVCLLALGTSENAFTQPFSAAVQATVPKEPFLTNNGQIPPASQYSGPMFQLKQFLIER